MTADRRSSFRTWVARATAVALLASPVSLLTPSAQAGPNLLPNASFEASAFGPVPDAGHEADVYQPLLPEGWAVEGSAGFFDHADGRSDGPGGRFAQDGNRFVAISIPASGKDRLCDAEQVGGPCVDFKDVNAAKRTATAAYSVNPAWRNAVPVAVNAGQTYSVSAYAKSSLTTTGSGAFIAVRWLSASAEPLSLSYVTEKRVGSFDFDWTRVAGSAKAPAGAAFAVVLLGHTDDTWIGSLSFDNAFFG